MLPWEHSFLQMGWKVCIEDLLCKHKSSVSLSTQTGNCLAIYSYQMQFTCFQFERTGLHVFGIVFTAAALMQHGNEVQIP